MHDETAATFPANAARALDDRQLRAALASGGHFVTRRREAVDRLPEFDALRDAGRDIKDHVLDNLDAWLEAFAEKAAERGTVVHWARDAAEARQIVLDICREAGARTVNKGKTMIGEEIGLNDFLETHGIQPVETDLGEYIIQLRQERPSHIIAPAVHVSREQVADTFRQAHDDLDPDRPLEDAETMVAEARGVLRDRFFEAGVGITGANFLVAETGSSVIVTNEGNGDLSQMLPRVHVVLASLEKVVPTLEDAATLLRILARSATGQEMSVYTTLSTGARQAGEPDGPEACHVVLLDNGRSRMLGTEFQAMLRCIRCGACMNHCPVYRAVGGHAYGWVYVGPMGAVLTPKLTGLEAASHLPEASTFCGRCESVCPMRIPLPGLMRRLREVAFTAGHQPARQRWLLRGWAFLARRPALYRLLTGLAVAGLRQAGRRHGRLRRLPFGHAWTRYRDFPAPEGKTFQSQWQRR